MVHVTFNDKVECHQYTSTHTEVQPDNADDDKNTAADANALGVQRESGPQYTAEFLKALRYGPHSQSCPDAILNSGIRKFATDWGKTGKDAASRQIQPQHFRGQRGRNQMNSGGYRDYSGWTNGGPIGSTRYTHRYPNPSMGYIPPDGAHRPNPKNSNEKEPIPSWFDQGPTSQHDCVELHGFDGPEVQEHQHNGRNDQIGCADCNVSGGPTSGPSSNNGSPPAKSTPAKVTFNVDSQRTNRQATGRNANWPNNFDNRHDAAAVLNDMFKNFSAPQNQSNLRGLTPIVSVQDVESALMYERLKFRQMVAQMQTQTMLNRNRLYSLNERVPSAELVLSEIDKILRSSNDPLYKRPDVRALTKSIVESVIPPVNIMNLLKNPSTEPQNRETIQAAVKVITQAKQNAAKAMKTRPPTGPELRAHADAILQHAIIKKRVEHLSNELMQGHYQQGGRNFPNQPFHQLFRSDDAGRSEGHSQSDTRGQCQSFENGAQDFNRWFSQTLLNKGQYPPIPSKPVRSDELETQIKQTMMGADDTEAQEVTEVK